MTEDTADLLARYQRTLADAANVEVEVRAAYAALETIEERFKMVLEFGSDYLGSDSYYCGHVELEDGTEVSLYDDLYWEKYETKTMYELMAKVAETHTGKYVWQKDEVRAALLNDYECALNQDTPAAAVLRDFLELGLNEATYNW
jgi:pyridoxine 5'-phosphate synthase PdxJ